MKHVNRWFALAGFFAIIAFAVFGAGFVRERPFSRFAPSMPNGPAFGQGGPEVLQQASTGPQFAQSEMNDVSQPLSSIRPIKPRKSRPDPDLNVLRTLGQRGGKIEGPKDFRDPVLQADFGLAPSINIAAPLQNFDGVSNVNGVLPPDTNGDVGPNHYMQWVNLSFAIYSKTGALLYGPAAGNTLWSGFGGVCATSNDGDPIVQYDHLADRWMVSQFALPNYPSGPFYQCIAVSQTGDPTGAWYRYQFQISSSKMNDYPHFGVWPDGYYMTVNQFSTTGSWAGGGVVAFERSKMLLGQTAQMVYFDLYGVDPNLGGMLPADLDGPAPAAGAPNPVLQFDDNAWGYSGDQLQIWNFHVDWATPSNSTFTQTAVLPVAAFDSNMCSYSRNCVPQQGTTRKLDAIADRLMYRVQYRNFGSHQTLVLNHTVDATSADRAGVRWYELRNSGGGWSIYQQGTYSPDAAGRWMASIAMDGNGNIGLGYSVSSSTMYPSIRYTGRLAGDALGQMTQGEGTLIAGTGAQTSTSSRWGDYSSISVDPVDDCTFWYTNEYLQTTSTASWRTRIGSFQLPGCGGVVPTPTPTTVPPTPTNTGVPPTPTNTPVPPTPTNTPPPSGGETIYVSSTTNGTVGGVAFTDEDILSYNTATSAWALYFDGSDVGITGDVNAFALMPDGTILLSLDAAATVSGLGTVDDSDIVRFTPTSLGSTTAGSFSWYFDGSDVGLTTNNEDIDAIDFAPDGRLVLSTIGSFSVTGASGGDEDLAAFSPTSLGATTAGTWSLYFDGSDVGLNEAASEEINGVWIDPATGQIYITTVGAFSVTGLSGTGADIFICAPGSLGATTTCTFSSYWLGASYGFGAEVMDGLEIVP